MVVLRVILGPGIGRGGPAYDGRSGM
jgi:hypothetical protein